MKKSLVSGCIGLVVASLLLLAGCPNPEVVDPNNYSIGGTVAVDSGMDVTQASVELWQGGAKVKGPIQPDSSGNFAFANVSRGDAYIVKISMGNTASWISGSISVPNAPGLKAALSQTRFAVTGTVSSDFTGADVTQAKLVLLRAGEEIAQTSPASGGAYEFTNLSAGTYFIRATLNLHEPFFGEEFEITAADTGGKDVALHRSLPELQKIMLAGGNLHLVWSQSVNIADEDGFSIGGAKSAITVTGATVVADTNSKEWTLALSRAPDTTETITLSYDNTVGTVAHTQDGAKPASFNDKAVAVFKIVSAAIDEGSFPFTSFTVQFSSLVDIATIGTATELPKGFELYYGGSKYSSICVRTTTNNSDTVTYNLMIMSPIDYQTVFTLSYSGGNVKSVDTIPLADFSNFSVTNNIPPPPPTYTVGGTVSASIGNTDMSGANVQLMQGNSKIKETKPDANGLYEFTGVNAGAGYFVRAGMDLYQTTDGSAFDVTNAAVNGIDLTLQRSPPELLKATAKGDNLHLVWNQSVDMPSEAGFTLASTASTLTVTNTFAAVANTNNKEWNITLNRVTDAAETITLSYDNTTGTVAHQDGTMPASITAAFTVTNGNAAVAFAIVSAKITDMFLGMRMFDITFTDDVDSNSALTANGFELYLGGQKFTGSLASAGASKKTLSLYFTDATVNSSTVFTLSYSGGTIQSVGGDSLQDFNNFAVTNSL